MKKRKGLILLISILSLTGLVGIVFAAFIFNQALTGSAKSGEIRLNESKYLQIQSFTEVGSDSFDASKIYYEKKKVDNVYRYEQITVTSAEYTTKKSSLYTAEAATPIAAATTSALSCYATKLGGYSGEDYSLPYLNTIGYTFNYKSTVDTYVRIEFQDAWKSEKTYISTNETDTRFISKDKLSDDTSPFAYSISSDWIFDEKSSCAYYKYVIPATEKVPSLDNSTVTTDDYTFMVNPTYWYTPKNTESASSYRERIVVDIAFSVSIVQANRAEKKWEVNFDTLGVSRDYKPTV